MEDVNISNETVETTEADQETTEKTEVTEPKQTEKPEQQDQANEKEIKADETPAEPDEKGKEVEDEPAVDVAEIEAKHQKDLEEIQKQFKDAETDLNATKAQLKKETAKVESFKEQVKTLETVVKGLVDAKLANIPEEFHGLIPSGDSVATLEWINKAEESGLFKAKSPAMEIGKPMQLGNPTDKATTDVSAQQKLSNYFSNYFKK